MWEDVIIVAIILTVIGLSAWYVIRAKRRGVKCIGCSAGGCASDKKEGGCGGNCSCCCGCQSAQAQQTDEP